MPKAKAAPPPQPVLAPDGVLRKMPKKPCILTYQVNDKKEFMYCFKHRPLTELGVADRKWLWNSRISWTTFINLRVTRVRRPKSF